MLPQGFIAQGQLVLDAIIDGSRNADSPSLSKSFHSGRDIYAISVYTAFLLDHISKVNPDAKMHPAVFRQLGVPDTEFLLNFHCTTHRIHYTVKFSQKVIPGRVHYPAPVFLNKVEHQFPVCGQGPDCRIFVFSHKKTVTFNIGAEDSGELSFKTFLFHGVTHLF